MFYQINVWQVVQFPSLNPNWNKVKRVLCTLTDLLIRACVRLNIVKHRYATEHTVKPPEEGMSMDQQISSTLRGFSILPINKLKGIGIKG